MDTACLHRLDDRRFRDIGGYGRALPHCFRSRRHAPPHRGDFRSQGSALLVDHAQEMANADRRRLCHVRAARRSAPPGFFTGRDRRRQVSLLSAGGQSVGKSKLPNAHSQRFSRSAGVRYREHHHHALLADSPLPSRRNAVDLLPRKGVAGHLALLQHRTHR